jgi:hypothetical protein
MYINYKTKIVEFLDSADLFYSLFNLPTRKPHRVCISDDGSHCGNCWGKLVIEGKTWREVYDILEALSLTPDMIAGRTLHEVPDNHDGKLVPLTNFL